MVAKTRSNVNPAAAIRMQFESILFQQRDRAGYTNKKTGCPTMSTMPGDESSLAYYAPASLLEKYADLISACAGHCTTCGKKCPGCYAMALKAYPDVFEKYLLNTIEIWLDPVKFYELLEAELFSDAWTAPEEVRIHEGGEFVSMADFWAFVDMAARHESTRFFGYSKDRAILELYAAGLLPSNIKFACSPWITADGVVLCAPVGNMYQYIFNDGSNRALDAVTACPCSNPDGSANKQVTCKRCQRCIKALDGVKTTVYPHGVAIANTWLAGRLRLIMAETNAENTLAAYRAAAAAAYEEAAKLAPAWFKRIASDEKKPLAKRIESLATATRTADHKAAKAAPDLKNAAD